jgi:uncharacterized protein YndB with AHSA1/START domain
MDASPDAIRWPEELRPEVATFHAVNELQLSADPANVWEWLRRPELWPRYYRNSGFVKHREGPWPAVELGSRWRWITFGVVVESEIVEFEPGRRLAWSAKELGARGHHAWILTPNEGGTFVHTEETQRGWSVAPVKPVMRRLMLRYHQRWLEGLNRVASEGPPS